MRLFNCLIFLICLCFGLLQLLVITFFSIILEDFIYEYNSVKQLSKAGLDVQDLFKAPPQSQPLLWSKRYYIFSTYYVPGTVLNQKNTRKMHRVGFLPSVNLETSPNVCFYFYSLLKVVSLSKTVISFDSCKG